VSNPKPQGGNSGGYSLSTCVKCGIKYEGKCLASSNAGFGCGKTNHKIRDYPSVAKYEGDNHRQAQPYPSSSSSGSHKQNIFYALQTCHKQEGSPDVVTGMLKVFHFDVYALLDIDATLFL